MNKITLISSTLFLIFNQVAKANEVEILAAALIHQSHDEYLVNVKLRHQDTGWDHYADEWRIIDVQGNILGNRLLLHPHVEEQPFTRALSNVKLDDNLTHIYIEAHDKIHGWAKQKLAIELAKMRAGKLIVTATP
ncbi:MAG: hypothetical protein ACI9QV_001430 [Methylophagaceae bacterium]|jgi:hypothetical protein